MIWLVIAAVIVVCFSVVLLFGAPYLPILRPELKAALELADLKPGQTMLELGCGDGRVLRAAAARGLNAVGYELNPILALIAYMRTRRYRSQVRVVWGNFWRAEWPPAEAVFTFLLTRYMARLDQELISYQSDLGRPVKLVSYAFKVPERAISGEKRGVYLYRYK